MIFAIFISVLISGYSVRFLGLKLFGHNKANYNKFIITGGRIFILLNNSTHQYKIKFFAC